jgi:hypothetical protein
MGRHQVDWGGINVLWDGKVQDVIVEERWKALGGLATSRLKQLANKLLYCAGLSFQCESQTRCGPASVSLGD